MEISGVEKAKSVAGVTKQKGVVQTQPHDRVEISPESAKRAEWVKMLHAMPDVMVQGDPNSSPSSLELAHKLMTSNI